MRHVRPKVSDTITADLDAERGRGGRRGSGGPTGRCRSGSRAAQPSLDVREVDAGVGADEAVLRLADDEVAAAAQDPHRLLLDERLVRQRVVGVDRPRPPSAFDTIFWVTTTTSPSRQRRRSRGVGDEPGQVVAGVRPRRCPRSPKISSRLIRLLSDVDRRLRERRRDRPGARMIVGATTQRTPSASTAAARSRVGLVDHERRRESARRGGRRRRPTPRGRARQQPVGRALQRRAGDDRRHRHDVGRAGRRPRRARPARRGPGRSTRSGSTGAMTIVGAPPSASSTPGAGPGRVGAVEAQRRHGHVVLRARRSTPGSRSRPRRPTVTRVCDAGRR